MNLSHDHKGVQVILNYNFLVKKGKKLKSMHFRWEFRTDGYDIAFGVFFNSPAGREDVVKSSRVNSHAIPEDGMITCKQIGTCKHGFI